MNDNKTQAGAKQERMTFGQFLKHYVGESLAVLRHPKQLIPTLVLGVVWIILGVMAAKAPLIMPLKVVSFLTFAQGGLYGGVVGAVGGIVGKVIIAAFLNAMIIPLFEHKAPFSGVGGGLKSLFRGASIHGLRSASPLVISVGVALVAYSLLNINQMGHNAMVGIVVVVMLLKNLGNRGGFMWNFLLSAANSMWGVRTPDMATLTRMLTGLTLGFALAVGLSVGGLHWCAWLGLLFLVLGFVMRIRK